jgi:hypothetical protein
MLAWRRRAIARSIDANGELTSAMAARIGAGDLETSWKRSTGARLVASSA